MVVLNKYYFEDKLKELKRNNDNLKSVFRNSNKSAIKNQNEYNNIESVKKGLPSLETKVASLKEKIISREQWNEIDQTFEKIFCKELADEEYMKLFYRIDNNIVFFENQLHYPNNKLNKVYNGSLRRTQILYLLFPLTVFIILGLQYLLFLDYLFIL